MFQMSTLDTGEVNKNVNTAMKIKQGLFAKNYGKKLIQNCWDIGHTDFKQNYCKRE